MIWLAGAALSHDNVYEIGETICDDEAYFIQSQVSDMLEGGMPRQVYGLDLNFGFFCHTHLSLPHRRSDDFVFVMIFFEFWGFLNGVVRCSGDVRTRGVSAEKLFRAAQYL